jgi:phospholipid/cholesterol/gamma-HCH transport system permease protein
MKLLTGFFFHVGRFCMLIGSMFHSMERPSIYYRLALNNLVSMVVGSMMILTVISIFIGAVTTLQTAYQLTSPLIPNSIIGTIVSVTTLLELAPTVLTFILAGRIGSQIASEIGTMRVREQIDALEVMGINSSAYLILPKIVAGIISIPILVTLSAFLLHAGGIIAGSLTGAVTAAEFTNGLREYYDPHQVLVMYAKALSFGFLITSVSSYQGYFTSGGALEVGTSATRAVVFSCLSMVVADYTIAQLML